MSVFTTSPFMLGLDALIVVQVAPINANGQATTFSPINSAGARVKGVPTTAPTLTRGAGTSDAQVVLTWTALTGDGATGFSAVTNYKLFYDNGVSGATTFTFLGSTGGATSFTQDAGAGGITPGTVYRY